MYSGDNNTITLDGKTFKVAESITNAIEDLQEDLSNTKESVIDLANSKVDKVSGKGLSTNDFTNADKTAIEDLQAQSGAELNITDENKLQLLNDSGTVVSEVALPTDVQPEEVSLEEAFNTRTTASNGSGTKYEIKDGSIAKVDYICGYSDRSGNLLNIADKAKSTTNGVSCVIKNGVVTLNGTATANTSIYLTDDMELEGTYQLNAFNTNAKASTFYVSIVNMYYVGSNVSATFDTATTTKCYIYYASGTVLNNVVLKPMLVKGKTAPTEFKPYYGVIRHSDTSELVSTGNNLFNIADKASTVINGLTYSVKDNVLTMNGTTTANTDFFFDFEMPKGKYYIKDFGNATADLSFALVLVDGLGNEYSLNTSNGSYGSTVSKVVEVKSDCTRLKVHVNANKTFTNTLVKPMLIRDTTTAPTEYQPYWQETLHIPASVRNLNGYGWGLSLTDKSKTNYIDYKRGKYVQNVASVDLGTLTWTKFTTPEPYNAVQFKAPLTDGIFSISTTIAGEVLCLQYDTVDSNTLWAGSQDEVVNYVRDINSDGTVKVHDTAYDSVDTSTFKTAMSGVILYYLLKTPIETDIDLTELNYKVDNYGTEKLVNTYNSKALVGVTYNADLKEQILANADNITRLDERVEVLENSGSDVEINPSDEATETAEKIKVGDTTYSVKEPNVAVDVNGNVIIGDGATIEPMTGSTITNATVVGKNAKAKQKDSSAKADNSVVIGRNATAESGGNIAIGNISISNGFNGSIAIG